MDSFLNELLPGESAGQIDHLTPDHSYKHKYHKINHKYSIN